MGKGLLLAALVLFLLAAGCTMPSGPSFPAPPSEQPSAYAVEINGRGTAESLEAYVADVCITHKDVSFPPGMQSELIAVVEGANVTGKTFYYDDFFALETKTVGNYTILRFYNSTRRNERSLCGTLILRPNLGEDRITIYAMAIVNGTKIPETGKTDPSGEFAAVKIIPIIYTFPYSEYEDYGVEPKGENLARSARISVTQEGEYAGVAAKAAYAVDGKRVPEANGQFWSSPASYMPEVLDLSFNETKRVKRVDVYAGKDYALDYYIVYVNEELEHKYLTDRKWRKGHHTFLVDVNTSRIYLDVLGTESPKDSPWGTTIYEIEAYGDAPAKGTQPAAPQANATPPATSQEESGDLRFDLNIYGIAKDKNYFFGEPLTPSSTSGTDEFALNRTISLTGFSNDRGASSFECYGAKEYSGYAFSREKVDENTVRVKIEGAGGASSTTLWDDFGIKGVIEPAKGSKWQITRIINSTKSDSGPALQLDENTHTLYVDGIKYEVTTNSRGCHYQGYISAVFEVKKTG